MSYVLVHLLKLNSPSQFVSNLKMALALPMAFGEIGLAIWLLVKGGKDISMRKPTHLSGFLFGGPTRTRTWGHLIMSQVL